MKNVLTILLLCCFAFAGMAQPTMKISVSDRKIGKDDMLQVAYIIHGVREVTQFSAPRFNGFRIAEGPIQGTNLEIVNGRRAFYYMFEYYLRPTATGRFTIPAATAVADGETVRSATTTVEVVEGSLRGNAQQPSRRPLFNDFEPQRENFREESVLRAGENPQEKIKKNLFIHVECSKQSCYVGEPVVVTFKLYTRLQSESKVTKRPSMNGFSVMDMVEPDQQAAHRETFNGKEYNTYIIRKAQLFPLQPGTIEIEPVEVENNVRLIKEAYADRQRDGSLLDEFFRDIFDDNTPAEGTEVHTVSLSSKPISITVKPLPETGKPASFNGAVGNFNISVAVSKTNIAAKDAAILRLIVSGSGNIPMLNAPAIQWPQGIEGYEPVSKENLNKTVLPASGDKTFEYTFIPSAKGSYTIPPVAFSFFDPASQSYKTVQSDALTIDAGDALPETQSEARSGNTTGKARGTGFTVSFKTLAWWLAVLGLLAWGFYQWRSNRKPKQVKAATPVQPVLPAVATPQYITPKTPLDEARRLLMLNNAPAFYKELSSAVWKFTGEQLQLLPTELNKPVVIEKLKARNADAYVTDLFSEIMQSCEMALYTPVQTAEDMRLVLEKAQRYIELTASL
jgi:hypothetical protein